MEYSINKLAAMAKISTRTLRYYDQIGLLKPARVAETGYRFYEQKQVDTLQQIMFYRELGFSLESIGSLLSSPDFDRTESLRAHLEALLEKRERLDALILNVKKSIAALKGEIQMSDQEKFTGFKQKLIAENERKFGAEIREKYGSSIVDVSNRQIQNLTPEQYERSECLRLEFEITLKQAFDTGDPAGESAQKACDLHRQWLSVFYPRYSKEYHLGLAKMYVCDKRFRANYDKLAPRCTEFLRDAIVVYCSERDKPD